MGQAKTAAVKPSGDDQSIEHFVALAEAERFECFSDIVDWLRATHDLGQARARMVAGICRHPDHFDRFLGMTD